MATVPLSCVMEFFKNKCFSFLFFSRKSNNSFDQVFALLVSLAENYQCTFFWREWKDEFLFNKGVWKLERAFQISCKKKEEIPEGGWNDYRIPKAWGLEQFKILKAKGY